MELDLENVSLIVLVPSHSNPLLRLRGPVKNSIVGDWIVRLYPDWRQFRRQGSLAVVEALMVHSVRNPLAVRHSQWTRYCFRVTLICSSLVLAFVDIFSL